MAVERNTVLYEYFYLACIQLINYIVFHRYLVKFYMIKTYGIIFTHQKK